MSREELTSKESIRNTLNAWKKLAEELSIQVHLGSAEARDEFEKQKKNLTLWLQAINNKLKKIETNSSESISKLQSVMEDLRVQAALGKADTMDELKEQQKKIADGIQQLKQELNITYEKTSYLAAEAQEKLDDFHTRFDLFRLQLHLGLEEAKDTLEEKKKLLSSKLNTVIDKLEKSEEIAAEKWENFSAEMSEAWKHVKNAF